MYVNNNIDNLFELFFNTGEQVERKAKAAVPAMNAKADDKQLVLTLEMPGFSKEDIAISLDERQLSIKAERKEEESEEGSWLRREIAGGKLERLLTIPDDIRVNEISADCQNGLLKLVLPKIPKEEKVLKIAVS